MKTKHTLFIIFFLSFTLSCYCQWFQQTLPVSGQIYDIEFFDANTGIISMNTTPPYILRTINGGNNWDIIANLRIYYLDKVDSMAVYGNGNNANGNAIFRSYDRGLTWDSTDITNYNVIQTISFFDRDTGLISGYNGGIDVIWKSTNGGRTMTLLSTQTGWGRLFILKGKKYNGEYYGYHISYSSGGLFKTTNSGVNWVNIPNQLGNGVYRSVFFLNKDTGWVYFDYNVKPSEFLFTSNSGINWITQYIDSNDNNSRIHFENFSKGWAGGGNFKIFATSNGGNTWGTQSIPFFIGGPYNDSFIDSLKGWCGYYYVAKTTNGGGIITYTGLDINNLKIPASYLLNQNYPNPFNPSTTIGFSIMNDNYVTLKIYNILGEELLIIYDDKYLHSGNYKTIVNFNNVN
ncbi:MAG: hypothetical protein JW917_01705, partial [Ignavibacteria bacterium]|nr:hypothetical protein [Ignavibacteria bacterium]